ncbi:unnamed protein product [Cylicocyclus nassatus]|nr:unnamed protein product [Cylicocyclus nassatus]
MKVSLLLVSWLPAFAVCTSISNNPNSLCVIITSENLNMSFPHAEYAYHAIVTKGGYSHNEEKVKVGDFITVQSFFCPLIRKKHYFLKGTPSRSTLYIRHHICSEIEDCKL